MKLRILGLVLTISVLAAGCGMQPGSVAAQANETAKTIPLTIKTAKGNIAFTVEVARTEEEQAQGLMYREELPKNGGMLFPFTQPRLASFWMKNTVIPLDMLFIRADGSIARIAEQTVPYSLTPVTSDEPVAAVFEIAGGRAAELGIVEGDKATWSGGPK